MVGSTNPASNSKQLSSYYESLRSNVMSILGQVKVPGAAGCPQVSSNEMDHHSSHHNMGFSTKENFDSYLTKLQTICTENLGDEVKPHHHSHHQAAVGQPHLQPHQPPPTTLPTSI